MMIANAWKVRSQRVLLAGLALAWAVTAGAAEPKKAPAPAQGAAGPVVLDESGWLRLFAGFRTPMVRGKDGALAESKAAPFVVTTGAEPPENWIGADFDDSSWARYRIGRTHSRETDYGFSGTFGPELARQCLRGRFRVDDPAAVRDLKLTVAFRGGMIAYVNGKEVARANLPKDAKLSSALLAEEYPEECFLKPDGAPLRAAFKDPQTFKDRCEKRVRRIENVAIPASMLRKGVNVVAFESFRAPYMGRGLDIEGINSRTAWTTGGLVEFSLTAAGGAVPNLERPAGIQVWNLDRNDRLSPGLYGDAAETLGPIVLVGAKNAFFSGQVALTSTEPIKGLKAEAGELKGPGTIPAAALRVRYAKIDGSSRGTVYADGLVDRAAAEYPVDKKAGAAAAQVLLTVHVSKDAAPGEYKGTLTVSAQGLAPVAVPVALSVADWTAPDPINFRTFVCAYQSPTSVALQYEVPEWSEEHWKYLEKSFELLGQVGNKAVHIPVVDRTQFGNDEGMVYWVKKEDGSYDYDLSVFDRYLDLAEKYCGKQDYVVLHVWHAGGWSDRGVKQENTVTVVDRKTGARSHMQVPEFATEESKKFWTPVLAVLKEHLARRGMEKAMCLGILSDSTAPKEVFKMFSEVAPGVGWHRGCHTHNPSMKPYGIGPGSLVTYHEHCYGMSLANPAGGKGLPKLWELRGCPGTAYFRGDFDNQSLFRFRTWGEAALWTNKQGVGRFGLDYWEVIDKSENKGASMSKGRAGKEIGLYNRWPHSTCSQREPTVYRMTEPGPDGAVPNLRFEAFREGLVEAEALIAVSEAANVHADRIGKELADRIQGLELDRLNFCRAHGGPYGGSLTVHTGWQDLNRRLFSAAAEAAKKLGK